MKVPGQRGVPVAPWPFDAAGRKGAPSWSTRSRLAQWRAHATRRSAALAYLLRSSGFFVNGARRSVWVHGEHPAEFESAAHLIAEVMRDRPNVRLVLTSTVPATVDYLRRAFPDEYAGPAPWDAVPALRRFVARIHPRVVLLLDGGGSFGARTLARVLGSRIPIAAIGVRRAGNVAAHLLQAAAGTPGAIRWTCDTDDAADRLRSLDVPAASITVTGPLVADPKGGRPGTSSPTLEALRDLLPDAPSTRRIDQSWRVPTIRERIGDSSAWKLASRALATRRIDDWPSLAHRLGHPGTILCLGNGPSSEDPRLERYAHDCLIRINWRWRDRGMLVRPDLVFAGDPATVHRVDRCVFAFWNIALERAMLLRHLVTRGPAPIEYVTLERVSPIIGNRDWPARPTNGALAIVAAAALRPQRLVIAGMDLFRHPDGRYPGDAIARNQYSRVHHESTELAIVDLALAGFEGELVILSDNLREELARIRENRGEQR